MRNLLPIAVFAALALAGCASSYVGDEDSERRAAYHMHLADSLEALNALQQAALEYRLVAELYPTTSHYPNAVRNTALLFSNPANPAIDDSVALHWFGAYLDLPIPREERVKAEIYVTMLKRIMTLRAELNRRSGVIDSLTQASRRQSTDLSARNKRIQDLEAELKKMNLELQNLREVDVRINRRKGVR